MLSNGSQKAAEGDDQYDSLAEVESMETRAHPRSFAHLAVPMSSRSE
jgi:hypothetical protein